MYKPKTTIIYFVCVMDWICSHPQNLYIEVPIPNVMILGGTAFGKWLDYEAEGLMSGISAFIQETPESSHPSTAGEQSKEIAIYEPGSGSSSGTECASTLILDLSASITMRNKCLLFKPICLL